MRLVAGNSEKGKILSLAKSMRNHVISCLIPQSIFIFYFVAVEIHKLVYALVLYLILQYIAQQQLVILCTFHTTIYKCTYEPACQQLGMVCYKMCALTSDQGCLHHWSVGQLHSFSGTYVQHNTGSIIEQLSDTIYVYATLNTTRKHSHDTQ